MNNKTNFRTDQSASMKPEECDVYDLEHSCIHTFKFEIIPSFGVGTAKFRFPVT